MNDKYVKSANILKAIAEPNRLHILDMLSAGELCACKLLEKLAITQPTLSHHMKILCDCGIVNYTKVGKWMHYSINHENLNDIENTLVNIRSRHKNDKISFKKPDIR